MKIKILFVCLSVASLEAVITSLINLPKQNLKNIIIMGDRHEEHKERLILIDEIEKNNENIFIPIDDLLINARDLTGMTKLMHAVGDGDAVNKVKKLLSSGADVNIQDDQGYTALIYAAIINQANVVTLLLKAKANQNLRPRVGYQKTAEEFARWYGHKETIKAFEEYAKSIEILD